MSCIMRSTDVFYSLNLLHGLYAESSFPPFVCVRSAFNRESSDLLPALSLQVINYVCKGQDDKVLWDLCSAQVQVRRVERITGQPMRTSSPELWEIDRWTAGSSAVMYLLQQQAC